MYKNAYSNNQNGMISPVIQSRTKKTKAKAQGILFYTRRRRGGEREKKRRKKKKRGEGRVLGFGKGAK